MTREDIDRIASEYFDDKESEHEMDEVFDLAKKALEERKADVLNKIRAEIERLKTSDEYTGESILAVEFKDDVLSIIDYYRRDKE